MERYTDPCYGVKMTHIFPTKQGMRATGQVGANVFRMPYKAKLVKFGIIVGASAIGSSTAAGFHLKTAKGGAMGGSVLATFIPGTLAASLGAFEATGGAPETATNIPKGKVVQPGVAVVGGTDTDNVSYFMEYERLYE